MHVYLYTTAVFIICWLLQVDECGGSDDVFSRSSVGQGRVLSTSEWVVSTGRALVWPRPLVPSCFRDSCSTAFQGDPVFLFPERLRIFRLNLRNFHLGSLVSYGVVGTLTRQRRMFKAHVPHACAKTTTRQFYCTHCAGTFYDPDTDATICQEASFVWVGVKVRCWPTSVHGSVGLLCVQWQLGLQ